MKEAKKKICLLMRRLLFVLVLLFFVLVEFQFAEGNILSIQGKEGFPYFDLQGNFKIVYINSYGGISIAAVQEEDDINKIFIQDIHYANNVNFIRIKKDKAGKIWLAWEERESGKSDIYIAQLRNKRIFYPVNLTADQKGYSFSPSIDFSFRNELWIAWVNYFQKKYTILVKNMTTGQIWEINSPLNSSAHSPQIIIDGTERIWLFWTGQLRNRDEILYTHFDGERWDEPLSLNQNSDIPHMTPSISLDYNGFPHIVWSAYDGYDYELYYSYWDGNKWIQEKRITNNQNIADTSPSISLILKTIPIVAWSRYINEKREVCLTYKINDEWSSEINISGHKSIANPPKLISLGARIGVLWQVNAEIKATLIHFNKLLELFFLKKKNADFLRILPLNFSRILVLDKDKYIGFGDSITYGIINNEPAPDKGYIPRLESLIDENIRESEVKNRGIGGEKTAEGLSRINVVINEDQAETIFLMEGTNDVTDYDVSMDTAAFNLKKMAERSLNFGMTVFLASIIPKDLWEGMIKERILDLNEKIRSITSELNIYFVDQFNAFGGYFVGPLLYSDATHPNERGYQLMAETWYDAFVAIIPSIETDTSSLSFEAIAGESNPSPQSFNIRNSGAGTLNYQISADQEWISVSPESGDSRGEWDEIEVFVDISNLSSGSYQGEVTITSEDASNSPQVLTIELTSLSPIIELDTTSLSFEGIAGESNPPPQSFNIRNSGAGTLNYQISADQEWISVSPESGDSRGEWDEIEVFVDISNLSKGDYQGEVTLTSENASNSPQVLTIELTSLRPIIELDTTSLSFEGIKGESNPSPQTFKIRTSGVETLNYQISDNRGWISVSPSSGDSKGEWDEIEVFVDISNLSSGSYQGEVTITSEDASNSPQVLTIELTSLSPIIKLDKTSLSFEGIKGESNPPPQIFKIRNSGAGTLNYNISDNRGWISISPSGGDSKGEWDEIEVTVDVSNLSSGSYQGNVTITSENASNTPQILTIHLTILSPIIKLNKASLSFKGIAGESDPPPQKFKIKNSGAGTLNYNISDNRGWISVSPESGDSKGEWDEIKISVDISNLSRGNYQGNVTISSENASNGPQVLTIQLTILSPIIELDKTSLSFKGIAGESNPPPQIFKIRNSGAGTLNYQISDDQEWISVSPESGDSTGEWDKIEVSVDISNLTEENYQANVTITSEYASNSPQKLTVTLTIQPPPLFSPLNFHGEKKKNRSLSQLEYINVLNWEANPQNKFIEKYKIYLIEGEEKTLLKEINAQTFEYWHRKVNKDKVYKYGLTAGDKFGRESEPVYIEVR